MQTSTREALPAVAAQLRALAKRHGRAHPEYIVVATIVDEMCAAVKSHMTVLRELTEGFAGAECSGAEWRAALKDLEALDQELSRR